MSKIKIVECPRDAMQGIKKWIPSNEKLDYLQSVLSVGFDVVDFGSFVSSSVIPQMKDTDYIINNLDTTKTNSKLLSIVANYRGAVDACKYKAISYIGYPFSISEIFQMRNANKTIIESFDDLKKIKSLVESYNKKLVVYISMGFGNPYGEPWNLEIVELWVQNLNSIGVEIISISDTIGTAKKIDINKIYSFLIPRYKKIEFGAHFHTRPNEWYEKLNEAYNTGCRRFDGAIMGFGGCPMAKDELTGNLPTEKIISFFNSLKENMSINSLQFESCYNDALKLFNKYS
ncbi:MAG: hydroxymethylglutaryl-CoA lyase [Flavobacteriaceae bacterium]|nr:hydroxymethylglutaryl-CoA lyase [Flavobacteriaceae bacterium]